MDHATEERKAAFEQFVADVMTRSEAVGLAVSVFDAERVRYQNFFGVRSLETGLPVDEDTIFGMASISKSFTALSIMQLAERGIVDVDAPIARYLPEFHDPQPRPVLVRHLMSHAGGFFPMRRLVIEEVARDMGIWDDGQSELTFSTALAEEGARRVAERLSAETRFIGRPGERMSYSNDSFGLLSEIIRRFGGEPSYADYVRKNILAPLGMTRSSAEFIAPLADANACTLYKHVDGVRTGGWSFYDNAFVLPGGGAMKSTVRDLRAYVRMYMARGQPLVSEYTVREMTRIRQEYRYQQYYGYGISTRQLGGINIHQHGGSLTGVSTNFAWSPQLGLGVIVLCNTSDVPVSRISDAAFRLYLGLDLIEAPETPTAEWDAQTLANACGHYRSEEEHDLEIRAQDGRPVVLDGGHPVSCRIGGPDLLLTAGAFGEGNILLLSGGDGRVWGIRTGGRIVPRVEG